MYLLGELRFGLDGSQATTDFKIDGIQFSANLGEDAGTKEALDLDASGNPTYLNFTHVEPALEVSASFQEGSWSLAAGLENEGDGDRRRRRNTRNDDGGQATHSFTRQQVTDRLTFSLVCTVRTDFNGDFILRMVRRICAHSG